MARRGVPPKPENDRIRRNAPPVQGVTLKWDGVVRGPELPTGVNWTDITREWWEMWRTSPQSMVMTRSDWHVMLRLAHLHNIFYTKMQSGRMGGTEATNLSSEIRRLEAAYGATHEDRLKLRMDIDTPYMLNINSDEDPIAEKSRQVVNYAEMVLKDSKG